MILLDLINLINFKLYYKITFLVINLYFNIIIINIFKIDN